MSVAALLLWLFGASFALALEPYDPDAKLLEASHYTSSGGFVPSLERNPPIEEPAPRLRPGKMPEPPKMPLPPPFTEECKFNYEFGGLDWCPRFPNCCGSEQQSPIAISTKYSIPRKFGRVNFGKEYPNNLPFADIEGKLKNDGHGIVFEAENDPDRFFFISGGPLGVDKFKFVNFHFHWGNNVQVGSEHTLDHKRFSAELHMVFMNVRFPTIEEAKKNRDGLAVLGMFVDSVANARDPPVLTPVRAFAERSIANPSLELPARFDLWSVVSLNPDLKSFFTYAGSLTTPTCDEAVQWVVFAKPVVVSGTFLSPLRRQRDCLADPQVNNFRVTQKVKVDVFRNAD